MRQRSFNNSTVEKPKIQVKYSWFIFNRRSMFAFFSCTVICIMYQFPSSFVTIVLKEEKHIDPKYHGVILAVPALFYVISSTITGYITEKMPRRIFVLLSFVLMTIALFLFGPSYLLHIPEKFYIFMIGYALLGVA
jgi:predicted MFS family arabinose efflux permease